MSDERSKEMHMHVGGKQNEKMLGYIRVNILAPKSQSSLLRLVGYNKTKDHQRISILIGRHTSRSTPM